MEINTLKLNRGNKIQQRKYIKYRKIWNKIKKRIKSKIRENWNKIDNRIERIR